MKYLISVRTRRRANNTKPQEVEVEEVEKQSVGRLGTNGTELNKKSTDQTTNSRQNANRMNEGLLHST